MVVDLVQLHHSSLRKIGRGGKSGEGRPGEVDLGLRIDDRRQRWHNRAVASTVLPNLRRAKDLADHRFDGPLDLASMASAAGFSKYHFAREFAVAYGETPMRYVTRRRIERAQDLLRSANLSVTEISILVGFNSLGSFTSRFTTLVGVSPTEYRTETTEVDGAKHIPGCFLFMRGVDRSRTRGLSQDNRRSRLRNLGETRQPCRDPTMAP